MEELKSPSPPRSLVTVRRNPPRRAKTPAANMNFTPNPTPTTSITSKTSKSAVKRKDISTFPLQDILECQVVPTSINTPTSSNPSENLRVFLRIKPLITHSTSTTSALNRKRDGPRAKSNLPAKKKPIMKKDEVETTCLVVNDLHSVTLSPPLHMQDAKRQKSEVYDGFTYVFDSDSSQTQVYEQVMEPLVSDFLKGKSGMLTALGPTGSGKTHTIFGSPRQPGMLSLALGNIFGSSSSSYYMSMFEIYSEREKGERLIDLSSSDGPDLILQQSTVKGLQEVLVSSVVEAEAMIARGMLKRATASTNSNTQSSRSQCIINIRGALEMDHESETLPNNPVLTIVDLAGAEREKKTGNQGTKLLQSNFINNTSMVFGLCLRSLLEHQKNPKKPLQKHFQNSLLTKYLRDYLEGKKRMALILTVKSGGNDYLDVSFLLRQASPYMKIKFNIVEEPYQKRNISKMPRVDKSKRRKLSEPEAYMIDESINSKDEHPSPETDTISLQLQELEPLNVLNSSSRNDQMERNKSTENEDNYAEMEILRRNEKVMQKFSKALWNVLKQYKVKFEESENELNVLRTTLDGEKARRMELENEIEELRSHSLNCTQDSKEAFVTQVVSSDAVVGCSNWSMNGHEQNQTQALSNSQVLPNEEAHSLEPCNARKSDSTNILPCSSLLVEDPRTLLSASSKLLELTNDLNLDVNLGRAKASQGSVDTCCVTCIDTENISSCKSSNEKRPRRKLLPASSLLLREVNNFDLEEETDRPLGSKAGRKVVVPGGRTQGSISLLKLLNNLRV